MRLDASRLSSRGRLIVSEPGDLARQWVGQLPRQVVVELAAALRAGPSQVRSLVVRTVAPASLHAARRALAVAEAGAGAYLAGLLYRRCAATAESVDIRPVWTGPTSAVTGGRLTIAAIADLVGKAEREILLVSHASYPPATLIAALREAVGRGVAVTMLLERPQDKPGWTGPAEPFPDVEAMRLCWPLAERQAGESLHAKVLVVDRRLPWSAVRTSPPSRWNATWSAGCWCGVGRCRGSSPNS